MTWKGALILWGNTRVMLMTEYNFSFVGLYKLLSAYVIDIMIFPN